MPGITCSALLLKERQPGLAAFFEYGIGMHQDIDPSRSSSYATAFFEPSLTCITSAFPRSSSYAFAFFELSWTCITSAFPRSSSPASTFFEYGIDIHQDIDASRNISPTSAFFEYGIDMRHLSLLQEQKHGLSLLRVRH